MARVLIRSLVTNGWESGLLTLRVTGEPIGGEDARENAWVERVAQASSLRDLTLKFVILRARKVDLDNLVRPAMRGLRTAGYFSKGFPELTSMTAIKEYGYDVGLTVESRHSACPGEPLLKLVFDRVPPSTTTRDWLREWASTVDAAWSRPPVTECVWIAITTPTTRSLIDLMKPVIDGFEPILGRDPGGRSEFSPNDDLVNWLQISRCESGPMLEVTIGQLPS
ncbi:MAG: hypothetical protein R3C18_07405 [Planctomycetaceae bacterium]